MPAVSDATLLDQLQWRYAVKAFDPSRAIPAATWATLEQALVLSPSSYGLQPWKFFVVDDKAKRAELRPHAWGQSQITDASHLVVFALKKGMGEADAARLATTTEEVRGLPAGALHGFKAMMVRSLSGKPANAIDAWMTNQVFIALGVFLSAAAMLGVDACPMEGFVPEKFDEVLGLSAKGYSSVVLATAGYRAASDDYATRAKVRYPLAEIVEHI
jgi:nitroreductase